MLLDGDETGFSLVWCATLIQRPRAGRSELGAEVEEEVRPGDRGAGPGGGTDGEDITVHRVPLAEISEFVAARRAEGVAVDVRIAMLLMTQKIGENGWLDG